MTTCEHEYENANCTNCANGLPVLAYECAETRGKLKEYCHEKAESIRKEIKEEAAIETLKGLIKKLEDRVNDYEVEYRMCGHHAIINRQMECNEIISILKDSVYEISPADCDW